MDESFNYVRRVVPATETVVFTPGNQVTLRDLTAVTLRDGTTLVTLTAR